MKHHDRRFPFCAQGWLALKTVLLLLLVSATPKSVMAAESGPVCSFQFENDFFGGGTDRHYTHGSRITCLTGLIPWITEAADRLPWFDAPRHPHDETNGGLQARASIGLGQNIYTPEDITATGLIKDDRPYAGWLYLAFGLVANQGSSRYDKIELDLGVVGPASLAEMIQKDWHAAFGLRRPMGWSHQLENEPGINLYYEQARRFSRQSIPYGLGVDIIPHFGLALGNIFISASTGLTARVGPHLADDFGPPRIRPSLPGSGYFKDQHGFNWYLFAGIEGRAVLHNIFLDGNTFTDSHAVEKQLWTGDLQAGFALQYNRFRLTYTQTYRTKEYSCQDRADKFGSMSLSYHF